MHVFLAGLCGGKLPAGTCTLAHRSTSLLLPAEMSEASSVAQVLNSFARDGLDMLGGADAAALADFLGDYMANSGSGAQPLDSKTTKLNE